MKTRCSVSVGRLCLMFVFLVVVASASADAVGPGRHYDRYFNHYADSFVTKAFMKYGGPKGKVTRPDLMMDQVRELVRNAWEITGGLHQIVYLVGAMDRGLDSGYPCMTNVSAVCRSSLSDDPLTSVRLAMREAREKYNCDLSFHFNMSDAEDDGLDWQECLDRNVIARDAKGNFKRSGHWCQISHAKDWTCGFAQRRIDAALKAIPELRDVKTIHLDAFFARSSEKDGITVAQDKKAIQAITDYWHAQGVDVTTEFITSLDMIGYFPMVWHNNFDEHQRVHYPCDLICGGDDEWNGRRRNDYYFCHNIYATVPAAGCLYEEAWGIGHWGDLHARDLDRSRMIAQLFRTAILFAWYNRSPVVSHEVTREHYLVKRANGVVADVRIADRHLTVTENGRTVVDGTDYFLDMPYGGGTLLVHSLRGCDRDFELPADWKGATRFEGVRHPAREQISLVPSSGRLRVKLAPGESLMLRRR